MIQLLLDKGSDINLTTQDGETCLDLAEDDKIQKILKGKKKKKKKF